jgi:hypothetical protein
MQPLMLTDASRYIAGAVLLTIVGIEAGGWFLTRIARGKHQLTGFQRSFVRAMHAHAGVLVILSLVCLLLADAAAMTGVLGWLARIGVPLAAALISGGFAASSLIGPSPTGDRAEITKPNGFIKLIWLGAGSLAIGVVSLAIGLFTA